VLILVCVVVLIYFQLGPNASIGAGAVIGPGVRIRESIVLSGATILDHSLVLYSIVGRGSHVGQWTRVE
jgi:mannose-1-phosphate guanylyltransferase